MKFYSIALTIIICTSQLVASDKPNIVLIYGDDMGIDSIGAFNDKLGLETPHLNRLVSEGMSFMDAHTTSAVCTPSRYGLLTGRYNWRSRLKSGIVGKWERPLIEAGRLTLPSMLKEKGYATTMIGKWHLGFNWPKKGGGNTEKLAEIDFTGPITGGPNHRGFDYWFGDDVPNWPPYAWRENDRLLGEITTTAKELGITKYVGVGDGPAVADWSLEAVLPEYAKRCSKYIHDQAESEKPFFLYFPMPSPHTPICPDENWKGKSGISDYADFLLETDWAVGELLKALDDTGQADKTMVIFATDNGTSPKAKFDELASHGVHLTEHWRGFKADAFEGGHRVPFIVRWPGKVKPGARCDQLVSLVDVMATVADIVGYKIPDNAAEDSFSLLPILRGGTLDSQRAVICHSISGHFAVRWGKWKALFCRGSGGWSEPRENVALKKELPSIQLYDLKADPKETTNVRAKNLSVVHQMRGALKGYVDRGRSTPGLRQLNHDGEVHWGHLPWKKGDVFQRTIDDVKHKAEGKWLSIPTPFPNIVGVSKDFGGGSAQWKFNKDATEIHVAHDGYYLITAEKTGLHPSGGFVFSALDAKVNGKKAKLETHPGNHRIGFWTDQNDYVSWDVETPPPSGIYSVSLVYSRAGKPGASVAIQIGDTRIPVVLEETGSWYVYQSQHIGSVTIPDTKALRVEVKSVIQQGAVMNLKAVVLYPSGERSDDHHGDVVLY